MNTLISVLLRHVPLAVTTVGAALLCNCSQMPVASSSSEAASGRIGALRPAALGTGWGESRDSRVSATLFARAQTSPNGVGELRYQGTFGFERWPHRGPREMANGLVSVGLKGGDGRWLPSTVSDGRIGRFSVGGEPGERYEIVVRNLTRERIEVVVSVDGLDVLDGRSAGYSKRGHIIESRGTLTIPGWRTSTSSVAAFRFAAVEDSYAAKKHGDTRNVGVVGVAVFKEKHWPMPAFAEPPTDTRGPNPFPGERWAKPPQG